MAVSSIVPLKGARIWLSGSIPDAVDGVDSGSVAAFVAEIGEKIFRAGGSIIHGSHPTIWPILLDQAEKFQKAEGSKDCLTLVVSRHFSSEPEKNNVPLDGWRAHSIVHEVPAEEGKDARAESLKRLRHWIAERCDAVIVVGGKWWKENPGGAGIPVELEQARERGLPCFLLAGVGGAAEGYLGARPEIIRYLRNGLDEAENLKFATERNVAALASRIVGQLCRLPLVRGEALGDSTFRILSLDGGGIKGTFTAAVLAEWECVTKRKVTDHFDLIAGTSTGGILALGLGMGLSASTMLKFYEERGSTVFPMTSVGERWWHLARSIFKAKFGQDTLRTELESAFKGAAGKTLSDSQCRLVVPACHARTGAVHMFRTNHHPDLAGGAGLAATDVAVATAAAPTYFRAALVDGKAYLDGGVWANNPTMAALVEALSRLRVPLNHVDILSVGTTSAPYAGRKTLESGLAGWLWRGRIAELLMRAQAQGTLELASNLAGRPRLLRVDQSLVPGEVSLDNVNRIADLKDYGRQAAGHPDMLADVKARFLNGVRVEPWVRY
jgi:predicted acylesterase/phospholipase RssA